MAWLASPVQGVRGITRTWGSNNLQILHSSSLMLTEKERERWDVTILLLDVTVSLASIFQETIGLAST